MNDGAAPPWPGPGRAHGLSLLAGWLPLTIQLVVAALLVVVLLRAGRRWWLLGVPIVVVLGVAGALGVRAWVNDAALATDPAPALLWVWSGVVVGALTVVVLGWPGAHWWRRILSVATVPLALVCVGLVLNEWVGYFPTVQQAWGQLSAGPLPDQVDAAQLPALTGTSRDTGALVGVTIPDDASGFAHREEYVYLPPAWFTTNDRASLPVVMMISGEFNTPADWIRTGDAVDTADAYARAHGGFAPVLVFVDPGGTFNNDTECVDGPRGNAADHLTGDVPPFVEAQFGVSADPARWGIVGWSMGGTCAVDLAVTHPELFGTFTDIAGDAGPTAGTEQQTIDRLFGGDAAAWARFDPATVMAAHGPYRDTAGWFVDSDGTVRGAGNRRAPVGGTAGIGSAIAPGGNGSGGTGSVAAPGARGPAPGGDGAGFRPGGQGDPARAGLGGRGDGGGGDQTAEARQLCAAATAVGIHCSVHLDPGGHTWQFASAAFAEALTWMTVREQGTPAPASG